MAIVGWEPSGLTRRILDWPFLFSDKDDEVEVAFENGVLRIQGRHEESEKEKGEKRTIYQQQRVVSFDYTTTLPRSVNPDKISAEVEDGVVMVKAPIAEEAKPKKIMIKRVEK
jgi:HSP20 family protein